MDQVCADLDRTPGGGAVDRVGERVESVSAIGGAGGRIVDADMAEEMVAKMPDGNGSLIEVPGAGHGLHGENMEGTVQILREFFAS